MSSPVLTAASCTDWSHTQPSTFIWTKHHKWLAPINMSTHVLRTSYCFDSLDSAKFLTNNHNHPTRSVWILNKIHLTLQYFTLTASITISTFKLRLSEMGNINLFESGPWMLCTGWQPYSLAIRLLVSASANMQTRRRGSLVNKNWHKKLATARISWYIFVGRLWGLAAKVGVTIWYGLTLDGGQIQINNFGCWQKMAGEWRVCNSNYFIVEVDRITWRGSGTLAGTFWSLLDWLSAVDKMSRNG